MDKYEGIIKDAESDAGFNFEGDAPDDVLCDGFTCRHDECDCWDEFRSRIDEMLGDQYFHANVASMKALYDGEVTAGIHKPLGYED